MDDIVLTAITSAWSVLDTDINSSTISIDQKWNIYRDSLQSIAAILMWFKFIYYLRATEETGWLIFMIRKVIVDMGPFLLVLLVTIMAFADAFYTLSNS